MTDDYPKKLHDVVEALLDHGWSYFLNHGKDTGDHPFISVEARRGNQDVRITWHTRATGTYRLFSCLVKKRDTTLTRALETITQDQEPS